MDETSVLRFGMVAATRVTVVGGVEVMEVISGLTVRSATGKSAVIAEAWVKGTIDVAIEGRAMMPGSCTEEDAAVEPFRAVVAVGSAVIGCVAVVTIRATRSCPYTDNDLSLNVRSRFGHQAQEEKRKGRDESEFQCA